MLLGRCFFYAYCFKNVAMSSSKSESTSNVKILIHMTIHFTFGIFNIVMVVIIYQKESELSSMRIFDTWSICSTLVWIHKRNPKLGAV